MVVTAKFVPRTTLVAKISFNFHESRKGEGSREDLPHAIDNYKDEIADGFKADLAARPQPGLCPLDPATRGAALGPP
ncbi:hypothetical protein Tco_1484627 [Tanacetum coccineum]